MKALCVNTVRDVSFKDIEAPVAGDGDVLLRVSYVGYCGSDLSSYRGVLPLVSYPRVPGHEISGIIEAAGPKVADRTLVGRKVVVLPYTSCGECSACRMGRPNACKHNQTLGVQREGGLTERIAIPAEKVIPVDDLPLPHLALVEPLAVGFHAARRAGSGPSDTVVVLGCGAIGLGAIAGAAETGARVIAVDLVARKLDQARRLGAVETIDGSAQDIAAVVDKLTDGLGPSVVIEAAGTQQTERLAIDMACYGGRVVYVGYAKGEVAFETRFFLLKELDIRGSRGSERSDFETVIAFLRNHPDAADVLISRVVPFEEAANALRNWDEDPGAFTKILVDVAGAGERAA